MELVLISVSAVGALFWILFRIQDEKNRRPDARRLEVKDRHRPRK
ncbi:MAG TPA: hypothetical protein PLV53_04115 [Anaerolineaceae bacterium]|jgi:hypothetical protein|nr:hypothetical protein [Anaerolineaceae bacterium]